MIERKMLENMKQHVCACAAVPILLPGIEALQKIPAQECYVSMLVRIEYDSLCGVGHKDADGKRRNA